MFVVEKLEQYTASSITHRPPVDQISPLQKARGFQSAWTQFCY